MVYDKPRISGEYTIVGWKHWNYDQPLFSKWTVSWNETAGCRHESCGLDWMQEEFATWVDALKFANKLTE